MHFLVARLNSSTAFAMFPNTSQKEACSQAAMEIVLVIQRLANYSTLSPCVQLYMMDEGDRASIMHRIGAASSHTGRFSDRRKFGSVRIDSVNIFNVQCSKFKIQCLPRHLLENIDAFISVQTASHVRPACSLSFKSESNKRGLAAQVCSVF
ncbi:hypothetical protein BD289DRAFT_437493 [Coniella lustricola]|uniref:Uncharacterized protein n=1 Tax=Coniella lustricola TaxID=2025994 RepID=A0A2T3A3Z9_9PEZI|nr:hypothetical protein BD289DRAFT_437493 [Coniella lustricola]